MFSLLINLFLFSSFFVLVQNLQQQIPVINLQKSIKIKTKKKIKIIKKIITKKKVKYLFHFKGKCNLSKIYCIEILILFNKILPKFLYINLIFAPFGLIKAVSTCFFFINEIHNIFLIIIRMENIHQIFF